MLYQFSLVTIMQYSKQPQNLRSYKSKHGVCGTAGCFCCAKLGVEGLTHVPVVSCGWCSWFCWSWLGFFTYLGPGLDHLDSAPHVFSSSKQSWACFHGESREVRANPNCAREQVRMSECFSSFRLPHLCYHSIGQSKSEWEGTTKIQDKVEWIQESHSSSLLMQSI